MNILAMTSQDFSNLIHVDGDHTALVYGWWWTSRVARRNDSNKYTLDPSTDHDQVAGGSFLLPEYGIGVNFEK